MGLWDKIKSAASAGALALGNGVNYIKNSVSLAPPFFTPAHSPRNEQNRRDPPQKEDNKYPNDEPLRLMEKADDQELAENIIKRVYAKPVLVNAGSLGRQATKHVSAILTGGSVLRASTQMELYGGFEEPIVESSTVPIEARVRQIEYIADRVMDRAKNGNGTRQPEAVRAVAGVLETVREARNDVRYSSLLENLERKLEACEGSLGNIPANERTPYSKEQLADMNNAYSSLVSYIWFGKNDGKKLDQAKQALAMYKQLRSNSVAAFNDSVSTRLELETLEDLMKLKEKALAANKDIETGIYARSIEHEDIRKYAMVAQTLRKHATAMDAEITKLEKLGSKTTEDQKNRKRKVKTVRESIDRTMKDIGAMIYRSVENSKTTTSAQSQECDAEYGSKRIVYEKAAPFNVKDLVLSPYDQLGKTQWSELANKRIVVRAYAELTQGVKEKTSIRTQAVELTQKEVLRAYDMARTITDGIHAAAGVEARKTHVDDVLNHLLEKMLYQKLTRSQGYHTGINAFAAYVKAREAEKVWRVTPVYNLFEMGRRNEARRVADEGYAKARALAPEMGLYQKAAERIGVNRRAA